MSAVPSASTSHSDFASIFNTAFETYKRKTRKDLAKHPLYPRLRSCDSPEAILTVLREQFPAPNQSQDSDSQLTKWVTPTVNVLFSFSANLGGVVGLEIIMLFSFDIVQSNIYFSGIPTSQRNLYGYWRSSLGRCPSRLFCTTYFDIQTYRRLKMPAPAKTSSLTSLTTSSISFTGFRYIPTLHRLQP